MRVRSSSFEGSDHYYHNEGPRAVVGARPRQLGGTKGPHQGGMAHFENNGVLVLQPDGRVQPDHGRVNGIAVSVDLHTIRSRETRAIRPALSVRLLLGDRSGPLLGDRLRLLGHLLGEGRCRQQLEVQGMSQ